MSVIVTRTIQIICLLLIVLSIGGIVYSGGNDQTIGRAGETLGFAVVIFLLTTILRVVSDAGEKLLLAMGFKKNESEKNQAASVKQG